MVSEERGGQLTEHPSHYAALMHPQSCLVADGPYCRLAGAAFVRSATTVVT